MTQTDPLARKLRDGLERLGAALRADQWAALADAPLNPTQAQILNFLVKRGGARVGAVAAELGVSQPTATDSIAALERKGLAQRRAETKDGRATLIFATARGRALNETLQTRVGATDRALAALDPAEQAQLLALFINLIRNLQLEGAIAPQRLCVTCRHFRPYAHDDANAPHHCAFVDAAFGGAALRLDCPDHEEAKEAEEIWLKFSRGAPTGDAAREAVP
ncbi:MarR family winged helix-turn-helix transcriptional regulator [Methylocystis sp. 9N]|uniref:MarR family winged helix-turn-helix transcriptional regulator n=1 Tax=Methylocystis borbori TaxID=3118750 RepID=A0ABU7XJA5_9HYPH